MEQIYLNIVKLTQEILVDETYGSLEGEKWISCYLRNISKALAEKGTVMKRVQYSGSYKILAIAARRTVRRNK